MFNQTFTPERLKSLRFKTPFLYMDLRVVSNHYGAFRSILPLADVHYAMKCNSDMPLLRHLHKLGSKFEIASYKELEMLLKVGITSKEVLFSNPVKIGMHIHNAAKKGVYRFA